MNNSVADLAPLAVYIHWPYCARICPYCDFNVYKGTQNAKLIEAILKDLAYWRNLSGPRQVSSIHFGGGTPSLLNPSDIGRLIEQVDRLWGVSPNNEIGLEANPSDIDSAVAKSLKTTGINRVSLGVQSFNDDMLNRLARDHDAEKAQLALKSIAEHFENFSADLIFGTASQSLSMLDQDLSTLLAFQPVHISTYQLTIEPGTAFERAEQRGQSHAVDADQSADYYAHIIDRLKQSGFEHYEISNFTRPRFSSQHNLAYWRGHDYVGVGPGAHGRVTREGQREAFVAHLRPDHYIESVEQTGGGISEREGLSYNEWATEYLLMGLRISEGISLERYKKLSKRPLPTTELKALSDLDLLKVDGDNLSVTARGRPLLDHITEKLLS